MAVNTYLQNMRRYRLGKGAASGQAAIRPGENAASYLGRLGGTVGIQGGRRYFTPDGPKPGQSAAGYLNDSPFDFAVRGGRGYAAGKPGAPGGPAATGAAAVAAGGGAGTPSWLADPLWQQRESAARQDRDNELLSITGEGDRAGLDYGIQFQRNAEGAIDPSTLQFDPSNPFSRAALLKKSWQQSKTGNVNSMASQGQLYSGALARQQGDLDTNFAQGQDALLKEFGGLAAQLMQRRYGARTGYDRAVADAAGDFIDRQLARPPEDPGPTEAPAAPARKEQTREKRGVKYKRHQKPDGSWSQWYRSGNR